MINMKLEIGTVFGTKDHLRIFKVTNIKMFPDSIWPFMFICLIEMNDNVEVEIEFETLCEWFKQTKWEIFR